MFFSKLISRRYTFPPELQQEIPGFRGGKALDKLKTLLQYTQGKKSRQIYFISGF